jgi:hypothetical protein
MSNKKKISKHALLWFDQKKELLNLYNGINSITGLSEHRRSIQSLMLIDNLHDFGHNGKGYSTKVMDDSRDILYL